MRYVVKYRTSKTIAPGRCADCTQHFINVSPEPGQASTGCGLSGELIPDDWDTEIKPWDKCPVIKVKQQRRKGAKR